MSYFLPIFVFLIMSIQSCVPMEALKDEGVTDTRIDTIDFPIGAYWINTEKPLSLFELKGHVVLLNFWTYCSINCIHVLPDLKWLEEKYKNTPFVIVGIHSAKFYNQRDENNVRLAVAKYEITYPVVIDNEHTMWGYHNIKGWPSFVLIDTDGKVILTTAGEGMRGLLDHNIRKALEKGNRNGTLSKSKVEIIPEELKQWEEPLLAFPGKIDIDHSRKQLFISDSNHNRILQVGFVGYNRAEIINTIGSGDAGADDGSFQDSSFNKPQGIVYKDDKLYVADTENHLIREIDLNGKKVKTIAGTGMLGYQRDFLGKSLDVSLNSPWDVEVDGDYLYIAMAGDYQIWRMNLGILMIEDFAGSGKQNIFDAGLNVSALAKPSGLAFRDNRLYFTDSAVSALRYVGVWENEVKTLIGEGLFIFGMCDGDFKDALLQHPLGLDVSGDKIYIADTYNNRIRVADLKERQITTIICQKENSSYDSYGNKQKSYCSIYDKECWILPLYEPNDVLYFENKLYIADTNNHLIRFLDFDANELVTLKIE